MLAAFIFVCGVVSFPASVICTVALQTVVGDFVLLLALSVIVQTSTLHPLCH